MRPITVHVSCDKSHTSPWEVYVYEDGKKARLARAKTNKGAKVLQRKFQDARNRLGTDTPMLTATQIDEYLRAKKTLGDAVTLDHAVRCYLERVEKPSIDLEKAKSIFLAEQEGKGLADVSLKEYREKLNRLSEAFPSAKVEYFAQPPGTEVYPYREFILGVSENPQTRRHYRTKIGTFFSWCESQNWLSKHPKKWVSLAKVVRQTPEIYTPKQVATILRLFEERCPRLVPLVSFQAFGGVRPSEASRQTRDRILRRHRKIIVSHKKRGADATETRPIENPPKNLWAWLEEFIESDSPALMDSRDYYQQVDIVLRGSGIEWLHDGLRKSCLSYYAKIHGHDKAADLAGHKAGSYTLSTFYKNVHVTKAEARAYFSILPKPVP